MSLIFLSSVANKPLSGHERGLMCLFKGIKFRLRDKRFKSSSNDYFFCIILVSLKLLTVFLAGFVQLICWSDTVVQNFSLIRWIVFQELSCYVFFKLTAQFSRIENHFSSRIWCTNSNTVEDFYG